MEKTCGADLAVEIRGLHKTYLTRRGRQVALAGLDLQVPTGVVHGFLGPNGSGKTTSIRMMLGLARPDQGSMRLFGKEVPQHLPELINRVGAIVESPKFFPHFSARRNLELLADAARVPRSRVDEVLREVGLAERGGQIYRGFSLGMRQRTAIAATLLKDPDLLIFDEPMNGLDPAGIREIRRTMRRLGAQGRTVLVSSHLLSEVEQVADTVSIIGQGRLLWQGAVSELLEQGASEQVRVSIADPGTALLILNRAGWRARPEGTEVVVEGVNDPAQVTRVLAENGLYVKGLVSTRRDLESMFLELTADAGLPSGDAGPGSPPELWPARPEHHRREQGES